LFPTRIYLSLWLLLCLCGHAGAQISGKVTDRKNAPVPFAVVLLQTLPDSVVSKTELTDTFGNYTISGGTYPMLLSVQAVGYELQSKLLTAAGGPQDFILSATEKYLSDVTVSVRKKLIERKVDRTVLNVENSIASIGSDAYEALKKAPGVRVSTGSISIVGKSTVSIMINDRLLELTGDELESMLRSIPSDDIVRIEVITTPPAKYDAQGNAGIINIVTRRSSKNGLNGNITGTYAQRVRGSESVEGAFNWRQGKLNVFGNGNSIWFTFTSPQNTTTFYPGQQQHTYLDQVNRPWYYRADVGADYNLTGRAVIGVLYTNGNLSKSVDQWYNTTVLNTVQQRIDSILYTNAHTREYGHRDVVNVNYEWKMDSAGKKLNVDVDYFDRKGNTTRVAALQDTYSGGGPTGFANTNSTYGYNNVLMKDARLDVLLPSKWATFSVGGKVSATDNSSENIFSNLYAGSYVPDPLRSDQFHYTENVQALYASAQRTWGKWEAKAGLRGEYTETEAVSLAMNETIRNEYFKLFPTAYLLYKANDDNSLALTYSRRIDRPNLWIMNPFREYITYNSYDQGNPFLQPSFSDNIEVHYTYRANYTVTLFTEQVQHEITHLAITDTVNNSYYYTQANAGTSRNYGISMAASFGPTPWWEGNAQASGFYNVFSSSYYGQNVRYALAGFSAEMSNSFVLNGPKTLLAEIGGNYTSREQVNYELQRGAFFLWGGMKALFMHKQLVVALSTEDPFRTNLERARNVYNGTLVSNYFDDRLVQLSVTWKFGNRYLKENRDHSMSAEDARRVR
jgi:outer membrane receptor protein involved in Fe transport